MPESTHTVIEIPADFEGEIEVVIDPPAPPEKPEDISKYQPRKDDTVKCIPILAAALALAGCTVPETQAQSAVQAMGMTNVQLGSIAIFGCDDHDTFTRSFTATGANGQPVHGVVCSGLFKGATVRITG